MLVGTGTSHTRARHPSWERPPALQGRFSRALGAAPPDRGAVDAGRVSVPGCGVLPVGNVVLPAQGRRQRSPRDRSPRAGSPAPATVPPGLRCSVRQERRPPAPLQPGRGDPTLRTSLVQLKPKLIPAREPALGGCASALGRPRVMSTARSTRRTAWGASADSGSQEQSAREPILLAEPRGAAPARPTPAPPPPHPPLTVLTGSRRHSS